MSKTIEELENEIREKQIGLNVFDIEWDCSLDMKKRLPNNIWSNLDLDEYYWTRGKTLDELTIKDIRKLGDEEVRHLSSKKGVPFKDFKMDINIK